MKQAGRSSVEHRGEGGRYGTLVGAVPQDVLPIGLGARADRTKCNLVSAVHLLLPGPTSSLHVVHYLIARSGIQSAQGLCDHLPGEGHECSII
eukprot:6492421-Amphidinium_carterae.2